MTDTPTQWLTRSKAIFECVSSDVNGAYFVHQTDEDDPASVDRSLILSRELFADLGRPDVLTVTIEPGDTLNPATP